MWDTKLFLWLNFDGGALVDWLMLFASGKLSWIPLYILILYLIYKRERSYSSTSLSLAMIGASVGVADLISGVFKKTGPLKHIWRSFPARLRPTHTPELEGIIHFFHKGGLYGTVSAHAATATAIAIFATLAIKERWLRIIVWIQCLLVCYSRIYLGYHFPQDVLLGIAVGLVAGSSMWLLFTKLNSKLNKNRNRTKTEPEPKLNRKSKLNRN